MDTLERPATESGTTRRTGGDLTEQLIEPFSNLRHELDRVFDAFPLRLPSIKLGRFLSQGPLLEMSETADSFKLTAELPGMEAADVEVTCDDGVLRIAGEKKEQREESERSFRLVERSYGAFERLISLPAGADPERIDASFKNGVLTLRIGKNAKQEPRKIEISAAD